MESYKEKWVILISGTDSRLGIGFRLGPNADFQYQIELGPQTRTQAIGPDAPAPEASKKRHITQNQLGSATPSKDKPHWIYTWNNINPGGTGSKDSLPQDFDATQQYEMTNGIQYGGVGVQNQGNHVASHLYKLYEKSTQNKQKSASTTPPASLHDTTTVTESHRYSPPKDKIGQAHVTKKQPPVEYTNTKVEEIVKTTPPVDKIPSVDLSTSQPQVHKGSSNVNTVTIPLEKPKQVNSSSSQVDSNDKSEGTEDQVIGESVNHDMVSEKETEDRISQIHALTHSQFIQRVPVSQVVQKVPSKDH